MAPASDFEKLKIAIHFGADAVYVAAKNFSLRNFSGNFSFNQLQRAVALAHTYDVKLYLACNIYSRNSEQDAIADFLKSIGTIQPDAVIIADPDNYHTRTIWKAELENINYRGYCTGFYFNGTEQLTPNFNMQKPEHKPIFVGKVITQPSPETPVLKSAIKFIATKISKYCAPSARCSKTKYLILSMTIINQWPSPNRAVG